MRDLGQLRIRCHRQLREAVHGRLSCMDVGSEYTPRLLV